jgi:quercetin dioxygenase-like cupin family protein
MTSVEGAKDLTSVDARPLDAELDGYAWIPRMLDKARATLAGTNGSYMFGCPVDHTCMARLGVDPELVLEFAGRYAEDRDVLEALQRHGIPSAREAWFDAPAVEDELQELGLYVRVRRREHLPATGGGAVFEGADHGASVSVALVTLEPGTGEPVHSHPTEEALVAVAGQATVFLGRHQARIVRAGELARVPADVAHRIENRSDAPFECVLAYGSATIETVAAPPNDNSARRFTTPVDPGSSTPRGTCQPRVAVEDRWSVRPPDPRRSRTYAPDPVVPRPSSDHTM